MNLLSLETQLPFYGAYHANRINVMIHMVFVPLILFTTMVWLSNTGPLFGVSLFGAELNAATLLVLIAVPGYIAMQPTAGVLITPILMGMAGAARALTTRYGSRANSYGALVHILSWVMQFVGHGVFEGRKPALLDNIFQAFYLAPFFVFLEVLFALGFKPALHSNLLKLTEDRRQTALVAEKIKAR